MYKRRFVKETPIPDNLEYITDTQLFDIIRQVLKDNSDSRNYIDITEKEFKDNLYNLVLAGLKKKRWYYKNLNMNIILKQFNLLFKYFLFKGDIEEYDTLCSLKANNLAYSVSRYEKLKEKFCGN